MVLGSRGHNTAKGVTSTRGKSPPQGGGGSTRGTRPPHGGTQHRGGGRRGAPHRGGTSTQRGAPPTRQQYTFNVYSIYTLVCSSSSITPAAAADPVNSSPAKLATATRSISLFQKLNPCRYPPPPIYSHQKQNIFQNSNVKQKYKHIIIIIYIYIYYIKYN